mmetsp:Transcript_19195/g.60365  ORF Transcript_19195/g.60365 Transcript_19195/m.60365 type:complete len:419 (+) Transcript_19195:57-1313(+)
MEAAHPEYGVVELAIGSFGGGIKVVNALAPRQEDVVKVGSRNIPVWALARFVESKRGQPRLLSGDDDGVLRVWDPTSGRLVRGLRGHSDSATAVACSTLDSRTFAVSGSFDRTVRVWDVESAKSVAVLVGHTDYVLSVACCSLSSDAPTPVSGSRDGTVVVWDVASQGPLLTLLGHTNFVYSVTLTSVRSGRSRLARLASCSGDATARLWEITPKEGRCLAVLEGHDHAVTAVCCFDAGRSSRLATGSKDATVRVWRADGASLAVLKGHASAVHALEAFSCANEPRLVSGSIDGTVAVWDPIARAALAFVKAHATAVTSLAVVTPCPPRRMARAVRTNDAIHTVSSQPNLLRRSARFALAELPIREEEIVLAADGKARRRHHTDGVVTPDYESDSKAKESGHDDPDGDDDASPIRISR